MFPEMIVCTVPMECPVRSYKTSSLPYIGDYVPLKSAHYSEANMRKTRDGKARGGLHVKVDPYITYIGYWVNNNLNFKSSVKTV